jgi:hypothetical protein
MENGIPARLTKYRKNVNQKNSIAGNYEPYFFFFLVEKQLLSNVIKSQKEAAVLF